MSQPAQSEETFPDNYHDTYAKTTFGFWLYLVSDFVLFGAIFAVYIVLQGQTFGGPGAKELFHLPFNLMQSFVMLFIALTSGMAGAYAHREDKNKSLLLFLVTFVLGIVFLSMECAEFSRLYSNGHTWKESAFLSSYYTLIGTHAAHVALALLFSLVFILQTYFWGLNDMTLRRLTCLRMFWQFINVVWVFIFSIVYLLGGLLG